VLHEGALLWERLVVIREFRDWPPLPDAYVLA
jgi:hypothetical protein